MSPGDIPNVELVRTKISPDILDTIGRSFKFRHGGGVAEWLKNALDNYLRLRSTGQEAMAGSWPALLLLIDGRTAKEGPNLAVLDFGGTTLSDIEEFFLHWGSRSAASLGHAVDSSSLTGGHGNGGKFYMREMWKDGARFLTFRHGTATSLVVEKRSDGNSGYWEFKDRPMRWREALAFALSDAGGSVPTQKHIDEFMPEIGGGLDDGTRGLTIVVGRRAVQLWSSNDLVRGGRWDHQKLVDALRDAPQSRRPVRELAVTVMANGRTVLPRMVPEELEDDPDWDAAPVRLARDGLGSEAIELAEEATFTVRKAAVPLRGRLRERNSISVLDGRGNPVATYPLDELPFSGHSPLLTFIHGEFAASFEDLDDVIQNDRERLVRNEKSIAILRWISEQIWARVQKLEETQRERARRDELEIASLLNDELNRHAKKFLEALQTLILVDVIDDPTGGGEGQLGGPGSASGGRGTGGEGQGGKKEIPGTGEPQKRPRTPQVLLSGYDPDPSTEGRETKYLTDRHPPLEQDDTDKKYNVWWINTEHPFAREAFKRGGAKGLPFRSYQLHMFRDVVQREALRYRQRREAELSLDQVENELTDISNRFLGELPHDLISGLLD